MMIADSQSGDRVDQMPSFNHSYICSQILSQLFQNQTIFPMPELTLDIGNGVISDISVYPINQVHPNLFRDIPRFPQMPMLAIVVVSASQNIQDLLEKAADLIQAGVKTVWTVESFSRTVFVTMRVEIPCFIIPCWKRKVSKWISGEFLEANGSLNQALACIPFERLVSRRR